MEKKLNIITTENEAMLRKPSINIKNDKPGYINWVMKEMATLMIENNGCGIAAPQVGINKRLFLAVIDGERIEVFLNPEIIDCSAETEIATEGCLSVPGVMGDVERHTSIKIRYCNGHKWVTKDYEGLNARIIQHEYDHLNGVLYIDKANNVCDTNNEILKEE